jgi:hypothetical protein
VDLGPFTPVDPQNWNRYAYVQNNPLKFIDPTGLKLQLTGANAGDLLSYLEESTGYKLKMDSSGNVTIDKSVKRNEKGTSKELADSLKDVIGAKKTAIFNVVADAPDTFVDDGEDAFSQKRPANVDVDDINALNKQAADLTAALVGHFLVEGLAVAEGAKEWVDITNMSGGIRQKGAHSEGLRVESKILSGFTGKKEGERQQTNNLYPTHHIYTFVYTSVQYDITVKAGANPRSVVVDSVKKGVP